MVITLAETVAVTGDVAAFIWVAKADAIALDVAPLPP
jgi:hypothetical protein